MVYFIIGGITLVIALSWNTAFSNLIQKLFPNKSTNIIGHFLHAIILTLIFIVLSLILIEPSYLSDFTFFRLGAAPVKDEKTLSKSSSKQYESDIVKTTNESYKPKAFSIAMFQ
jgi:hypothetical protein